MNIQNLSPTRSLAVASALSLALYSQAASAQGLWALCYQATGDTLYMTGIFRSTGTKNEMESEFADMVAKETNVLSRFSTHCRVSTDSNELNDARFEVKKIFDRTYFEEMSAPRP
jgi:hypothetical protein